MSKKDYYELLGVSKDADKNTIKKAYRKLAMKYHPDRNQHNDQASEAKFKEINEAYAVLSDEQKRSTYDQFGHEGLEGGFGQNSGGFNFGGGFGGFEDIFGSFFGGGNRRNHNQKVPGQDQLQHVNINFFDSINGTTFKVNPKINVNCDECNGTGAKNPNDVVTCDSCHGRGTVQQMQRTPFGNVQSTVVCRKCSGEGKFIKHKCKKCKGRKVNSKTIEKEVKIPAGINSGQRLRLSGMGGISSNGGPNGDLYLEINVGSHQYFKRENNDIYLNIPVTLEELVLGTNKIIPTPYGEMNMKIPAKTNNLQKFRIKNKGMPILNSARFGNMYVSPEITIPKNPSKAEIKLFKSLSKIDDGKIYQDFLKKFNN